MTTVQERPKVTITLFDLLPFILMINGVLLLGAGAIWQLARQHQHREEHRQRMERFYDDNR